VEKKVGYKHDELDEYGLCTDPQVKISNRYFSEMARLQRYDEELEKYYEVWIKQYEQDAKQLTERDQTLNESK
jgi:hypothetical protein